MDANGALQAAREELAGYCGRLIADGLAAGAAGNLSVRVGDLIAITPSGVRYSDLVPPDICVVTLTGQEVEARERPSTELPMHLAIYASTSAGAVVHTHSAEVIALSATREELPAIHYAITDFGGPVRVARYTRFGSAGLAEAAVEALSGRSAAILQNHGAVCHGRTLTEAYDRALLLEWLAKVFRLACSYGQPRILTQAELDEVSAESRRIRYGERRETARRETGESRQARPVTIQAPDGQAAHTQRTREAYDQLAAVWSSTTDDGPFNGLLERPALRSLVPRDLRGAAVLDAGCGSGAQAEWLLDQGADVVAIDISPRMIEEARRRCAGRGRFLVADLAEPLPLDPASLDGITCSLALHYVADWSIPLRSFASVLRPGGWVVISVDHPFGPPSPHQRRGYFDTELVSDTWRKGDIEVTQHFWRRPLGAVLRAFADAGFTVDRVAEPQPSREALRLFPEDLGSLVGVPLFIVYRLWLQS